MQVPDGKNPGDTFDAMTTYLLGDKPGEVTLKEVDGEPVDGKDTDDAGEPNDAANDDTTAAGGVGGMKAALMGGQ